MEFRFPRSTVWLMVLIFLAVVVAIEKATSVELKYGGAAETVWPSLAWSLGFMVLTMFAAAAIVWGILFVLRRTGMHRLANVQTGTEDR